MTLSPKRARFALLALALGGFSIGSTEFVAMGLLPNIARDLLLELTARNPVASIGRAGWLDAAYAVGVVVGAPTWLGLILVATRVLVALVGWSIMRSAATRPAEVA